jgi:hypothetical protein
MTTDWQTSNIWRWQLITSTYGVESAMYKLIHPGRAATPPKGMTKVILAATPDMTNEIAKGDIEDSPDQQTASRDLSLHKN